MPPTGDRLGVTVVGLGKNYPMFSHTGIGFVGIFILVKAQARTWCLLLSLMMGLSQSTSEAGPEELNL